MHLLDNPKTFKRLDRHGVVASAERVGSQLTAAWCATKAVSLPASYRGIDRIVVSGMGGSALGAHIIQTLFADQLPVPFTIINDYRLPASVGRNTLYVVSSYSGTTEEPLATIAAATKRHAKLFAITAGGTLGNLVRRKKVSGVVLPTDDNPSGQPRMGLGYSLGAQLALLSSLKLISVSDADVAGYVRVLAGGTQQFGTRSPYARNAAKQLAETIAGRIPMLLGAEFLVGNLHAFANQINENAKTFASYFPIPEVNHHLLEGLRFPKPLAKTLAFVIVDSPLYLTKNRTRVGVTATVIKKNRIPVTVHTLRATTRAHQAFELLSLGTYVSIYAAMRNGIDPAPIPWVDFFKSELKKRS